MRENILMDKALSFAVRIVKLSKILYDNKHKIIANQILRSGTSIGANVAESVYASSKADFVNKLYIAQKEASETKYWLVVLNKVEYIEQNIFDSLYKDITELMSIIGSSLNTAKR